jgi:hypothetical protein
VSGISSPSLEVQLTPIEVRHLQSGMTVDLLRPPDVRWSAFLRETDHDFYYLPAYVELCASNDGGEAAALFVEQAGQRLLLPILLRPIEGAIRDAATPYGYSGPLTVGQTDTRFVLDALVAIQQFFKERGVVSLFVRSHPLLSPPLEGAPGTLVNHGLTVSIDLTLSSEELWRRTSSSHRNEIRKALRLGHAASVDNGFTHLDAFMRLYRATMVRVEADACYAFTDEYFAALRTALGSRLHLCIVDIGGDVAGGGLFVETGGLIQYHLSGTDPRFIAERPTKLMLHFIRMWAKERGLLRLHLGGGVGGVEDSLFRFKAGFSTDRHPFQTLRMICDEAGYSELVDRTARGPEVSAALSYFPAYRRSAS